MRLYFFAKQGTTVRTIIGAKNVEEAKKQLAVKNADQSYTFLGDIPTDGLHIFFDYKHVQFAVNKNAVGLSLEDHLALERVKRWEHTSKSIILFGEQGVGKTYQSINRASQYKHPLFFIQKLNRPNLCKAIHLDTDVIVIDAFEAEQLDLIVSCMKRGIPFLSTTAPSTKVIFPDFILICQKRPVLTEEQEAFFELIEITSQKEVE